MYISVTRLKLRNIFQLFRLMKYSTEAFRQAIAAKGNLHAELKNQNFRFFWTLTVWESKEDMQKYMRSDRHLAAMKRAPVIASSVDSYGYEAEVIPSWNEAMELLCQNHVTFRPSGT